jgi:uncharacterized protein YfaP (DUF2135 family)
MTGGPANSPPGRDKGQESNNAGLPAEPGAGDVKRAQERGAHAGKLQIILTWGDRSDLDLHVVCPNGGEISHSSKNSCGGHLDVDANSGAETMSATPVEHVFFDDPAPGTYRVVVDPYSVREGPESHYRITVRQEGQPDQVIEGNARGGARNQTVTQIEVGPG